MATFCSIAYLTKPAEKAGEVVLAGSFAPVVHLLRGVPEEVGVEVRRAEKRQERSPDFRVVAINGAEAEIGALWKSREGQSSMANGKVDGAAGLMLGVPAGARLLVQATGDGDPEGADYKLTIVVEDATEKASQARDFGDDDSDPFA